MLTPPTRRTMLRKATAIFYRDADGGGKPGNSVPAQVTSVSDLMAGAPDDPSPSADVTPAEPPKQRRAKVGPKADDQGATDPPEPVSNDQEPADPPAEPEAVEPSNDDWKTLHEAKAASNKRLRSDNEKLRESVAGFEADATTFRGVQAMLNDTDPARFKEGMGFLLEAAAAQFGGDIGKALAAAGYEATPVKPANPLDAKREAVKAKATDLARLQEMGYTEDELELIARDRGDLVDMIFDALGPELAQPAQRQAPGTSAGAPAPGGDHGVGTFDNMHRAAVEAIQEEAPLFECSTAEAKEAFRRFENAVKAGDLTLEDAIRLTFKQRLDEEKAKQNAGNVVRPMVQSNGKVGGHSVLDPDRVGAGPINLAEAYESFRDKPTQ